MTSQMEVHVRRHQRGINRILETTYSYEKKERQLEQRNDTESLKAVRHLNDVKTHYATMELIIYSIPFLARSSY